MARYQVEVSADYGEFANKWTYRYEHFEDAFEKFKTSVENAKTFDADSWDVALFDEVSLQMRMYVTDIDMLD